MALAPKRAPVLRQVALACGQPFGAAGSQHFEPLAVLRQSSGCVTTSTRSPTSHCGHSREVSRTLRSPPQTGRRCRTRASAPAIAGKRAATPPRRAAAVRHEIWSTAGLKTRSSFPRGSASVKRGFEKEPHGSTLNPSTSASFAWRSSKVRRMVAAKSFAAATCKRSSERTPRDAECRVARRRARGSQAVARIGARAKRPSSRSWCS